MHFVTTSVILPPKNPACSKHLKEISYASQMRVEARLHCSKPASRLLRPPFFFFFAPHLNFRGKKALHSVKTFFFYSSRKFRVKYSLCIPRRPFFSEKYNFHNSFPKSLGKLCPQNFGCPPKKIRSGYVPGITLNKKKRLL